MLYRKFEVEIKRRDTIYGGLPKSKQILDAYVTSKVNSDDTTLTETDLIPVHKCIRPREALNPRFLLQHRR